MIRTAIFAGILAAATALPASAAPLLGDFECLSDLGGPETYHGTLRIEEPTQFGFLDENFVVAAWYPLDIADPKAVVFDDAFAQQISSGATMVDAHILDFAYVARIRTKKGDNVTVDCNYVY